MARVLVLSAKTVGFALVLVAALAAVGAFLPGLSEATVPGWPVVGVAGAVASGFGGWVAVASLVVLVLSVVAMVRRRTVLRVTVAALATVSLVGFGVTTLRLMSVGNEHDTSVNPLAGLPGGRAPDETAIYGQHQGDPLRVSLWTPQDPAGSGAPVAFFTHGGGWTTGDPADDTSGMKTQLAEAGWLVVSVEYTLATPTQPTAGVVEDQVACAAAWTAANAGDYGGDTSTFVSFGDSAGGNLAINTSSRMNAGELSCGDQPVPQVDATAVLFPAVDPVALYTDSLRGIGTPARGFTRAYIGGSPRGLPEAYAEVDSSRHIDSTAPPTLVLQGEHDHLVQAHSAYEFVEQARDAGVDATLVRVPFAEHGFDLTPLGSQLYRGITSDWLKEKVIPDAR